MAETDSRLVPARDFSVMPVQFPGDDVPYERRVRNLTGSLKAGTICDVEIGAWWNHDVTPPKRIPGTYVRCEVTRTEGALLYVRSLAATAVGARACRCDEGWVCEDHPDQPLSHDHCGAAGKPCTNPLCPWWKGPKPAATDLSSERKKPS